MSADDPVPEFNDAEKIRSRAMISDLSAMGARLRDGRATEDDVAGAVARIMSLDIDRDTFINALHIPADAGPYASALENILRRIPDGWGRWFSHDAGWYAITVACDQLLAAIDPNYVVHQIKEKFGTLRYYCAPSGEPRAEVYEAFDRVTSEAQRVSAITCECCGGPGDLYETRYRAKTLCTSCADTLGYPPAPPPEA
jgi:hypothetical protein